MDATGTDAARDELGRGTTLALLAMALGIFVIANDFTALSVAIPRIEQSLGTDLTTTQWVINAYALAFGVLIVSGGRVADLFGRKRVFLLGTVVFGVFSLLGGLAPNVGWLVGCRVMMAVGGAMMWPAVLGIVYAILPASKAGLAGGLVIGVAGIGNAVGPLLGGLLTDVFSWRWVFFANAPIAAFAMLVTLRTVPETRGEQTERRIDAAGITTLSIGVVALLLALDEGPDRGFGDPLIVVLFATSAVMLALFGRVESRVGGRALVPREVLRNRQFTAACLTVLMMSAIFFSALLYLPQLMTRVYGYSAIRSGAGLLPLMGTFALVSFVAGPLYGRMGAKRIVSVGAACLGVGMLVLSFSVDGAGYVSLVPGMLVLAVGIGLFYSSITTAGVTALDPSQASLAGGIVYMCQIAGGAIGLGVNTAIVTSSSTLTRGIALAFFVDALLAGLGLLVALAFVGESEHAHAHPRRSVRWLHRAHA